MDLNRVMNIIVMVIASAVMLVGVLAMVGLLIPVYIPEEFRVIISLIVFLYGLYRFVLSYARLKRREP
jgi:cation transport ATPase